MASVAVATTKTKELRTAATAEPTPPCDVLLSYQFVVSATPRVPGRGGYSFVLCAAHCEHGQMDPRRPAHRRRLATRGEGRLRGDVCDVKSREASRGREEIDDKI